MIDDSAKPNRPLLALFLLLVGSAGAAAIWVMVSLAVRQQASWMAVLAALDAAFLLRYGGMRSSWARSAWAVIGTAGSVALANWGIAATQMGMPTGLPPWVSIQRLGAEHAWTLFGLANPAQQLAWIGAALVIALVTAR